MRMYLLRADLFCGMVVEQLLVCGLGGMCWACHQLVPHGMSPGQGAQQSQPLTILKLCICHLVATLSGPLLSNLSSITRMLPCRSASACPQRAVPTQANSIHVWSLENREVMTANPFPLVHAVRRIQKRLEGREGKGHGMTVPVLHTDSGQPYILFQARALRILWGTQEKL